MGQFLLFLAYNVNVAASGVFVHDVFLKSLAQKLSGEAQGGPNSFCVIIYRFCLFGVVEKKEGSEVVVFPYPKGG